MPDTANLSAFARGMSDPARGAFAVTKSDVTVFDNVSPNPPPARSLYVGGTGDVAVQFVDGTTAIFKAVPTGFILPIHVNKVLATGTTATAILGLY